MKIFITGSTGFIGKSLLRRLASTKYELRCLVRKNSDTSLHQQMNLELVHGDVTDRQSVQAGIDGCNYIVHCAALTSPWEAEMHRYTDVNIHGTRNVMEAAIQANISKVVDVSTVNIFGKPKNTPFSETSTPGTKLFSEYARTKYEAHQITRELHDRHGLPLITIYPTAVVGPEDTEKMGIYIYRLANGKFPVTVFNNSVFTYVDVRDVAEAIVKALEAKDNIGERYIIGNERLSFAELNRLIHEISGSPTPKFHLPDTLALSTARLLTAIANITKKPPLFDMSTGQLSMMQAGFQADGTKAEQQLGITYTPIRTTVEEVIAYHQNMAVGESK